MVGIYQIVLWGGGVLGAFFFGAGMGFVQIGYPRKSIVHFCVSLAFWAVAAWGAGGIQ